MSTDLNYNYTRGIYIGLLLQQEILSFKFDSLIGMLYKSTISNIIDHIEK